MKRPIKSTNSGEANQSKRRNTAFHNVMDVEGDYRHLLGNLKILTESLFRKFKLPKTYRVGRKSKETNEHGNIEKLSKMVS